MTAPGGKEIDLYRTISLGLMGLLTAAMIWVGKTVVDQAVALGQVQVKLDTLGAGLVAGYTARDATADAQRQTLIDNNQDKDRARLDARLAAVEDQMRRWQQGKVP